MLNRPWIRRGPKRWIKESKYLSYVRFLWPDYRVWSRKPGTLPSFLIVGAQRAGSTFLHDYLVAATSAKGSPLQKEVHFFDNKYYRSLTWYSRFFDKIEEKNKIKKNFETSPYYLYHPAVPRRVAETIPDIDIVIILRNPVDRAISHYKWMWQNGLETRSALEAFRVDAKRFKWESDPNYLEKFDDPFCFRYEHIHTSYLRRSRYSVQIERWLQHMDSSQIRIVNSVTLFEEPNKVVNALSSFLGIEHTGGAQKELINQNSSRDNISVSPQARAIASRYLKEVSSNVEKIITDEMVIGETEKIKNQLEREL